MNRFKQTNKILKKNLNAIYIFFFNNEDLVISCTLQISKWKLRKWNVKLNYVSDKQNRLYIINSVEVKF